MNRRRSRIFSQILVGEFLQLIRIGAVLGFRFGEQSIQRWARPRIIQDAVPFSIAIELGKNFREIIGQLSALLRRERAN